MKIQRYEHFNQEKIDNTQYKGEGLIEDDNGEWVRWEDVKHLIDEEGEFYKDFVESILNKNRGEGK